MDSIFNNKFLLLKISFNILLTKFVIKNIFVLNPNSLSLYIYICLTINNLHMVTMIGLKCEIYLYQI